MRIYFRAEMNRVLRSGFFWTALMIGCLIAVLQYLFYVVSMVQYLDTYLNQSLGTLNPHTWYEKWIGGEMLTPQAYLYFLILPVLSALPCGTSLLHDRSTGYTAQMFVRGERKHYYFAKASAAFLSGGIVTVIPLIVNIMLSTATLPSVRPDWSTGRSPVVAGKMWASWYYDHPNLYIFLYLILIFVFAGLVAAASLTMGAYIYNSFLVLAAPFVLHLFIYSICATTGNHRFAPFSYLTPAQRGEGITIWIILAEYAAMFLVTAFFFLRKMKRDETID